MTSFGIPIDQAPDGTPLDQIDFDALHKPFAEPLGWLVLEFSYLEKELNWCVTALAGVEAISRAGEAIVGSMPSFTRRLAHVREEILLRRGPSEEWISLERRMRELNRLRNFAIHGLWGAFSRTAWGEPAWQVQKVDPKTNKISSREFSVSQLQEARREALRLSVAISNYVQAITDPRPPAQSAPQPSR